MQTANLPSIKFLLPLLLPLRALKVNLALPCLDRLRQDMLALCYSTQWCDSNHEPSSSSSAALALADAWPDTPFAPGLLYISFIIALLLSSMFCCLIAIVLQVNIMKILDVKWTDWKIQILSSASELANVHVMTSLKLTYLKWSFSSLQFGTMHLSFRQLLECIFIRFWILLQIGHPLLVVTVQVFEWLRIS